MYVHVHRMHMSNHFAITYHVPVRVHVHACGCTSLPFRSPAFENFSCRDDKYLKALLSDPNLTVEAPGRRSHIHLKSLQP